MIFRPELAELVLVGAKTMTRRPVGDGPCRYRVGRSYAVQDRRGGRALGRIHVREVRKEHLDYITHEDARAEGFADLADFRRYWIGLYGAWHRHTAVWVITFRRDGEAA